MLKSAEGGESRYRSTAVSAVGPTGILPVVLKLSDLDCRVGGVQSGETPVGPTGTMPLLHSAPQLTITNFRQTFHACSILQFQEV